jgi:hypothetical protein
MSITFGREYLFRYNPLFKHSSNRHFELMIISTIMHPKDSWLYWEHSYIYTKILNMKKLQYASRDVAI